MLTRFARFAPLLIILVGVVAYANSFRGAFVHDDARAIVTNARIRRVATPAGPWLEQRGFANLTFALNYATGRLNPADYHATNLAIHLAAALLLFGLVRRTLALEGIPPRLRAWAGPAAAFTACLWVAHPLTTAAVTYVCQRYEALMALFYLASLYAVVRGATAARPGPWYALAVLGGLLGMASKEVMVTAPVAVLLYDRVFLARSWRALLRRRWRLHAGMALAWVLLAFLAAAPSSHSPGATLQQGSLFAWRYAATQAGVLLHYLRLAAWPHPLCMDYGWPLVTRIGSALPALIPMSILAAAVLWGLWTRPRGAFAPACFFLILAPTSSFVPRPDAAFEHRMYLPLAAVLVTVVLAACRLVMPPIRRAVRSTVVFLGLAAVVALAAATHARNRTYVSEEEMWLDVAHRRPANVRAYLNLANCTYDAGRYGESLAYAQRALTLLPDFRTVSREDVRAGHGADTGADVFRRAYDYGGARNSLGLALLGLGRPPEAEQAFREALRVTPGNTRARHNLGLALFQQQRHDEAAAEWLRLLATDPGDADVHRALAEAAVTRGDRAAARRHYRAVVRLRPDDAAARARLNWLQNPAQPLERGAVAPLEDASR